MVAVPLLLLLCLYTFWCSVFYFLASAASSSTCDMCLRFRGCPVVLGIELSASAQYQQTRVLLRARRVFCCSVAAASGINFKITCNEVAAASGINFKITCNESKAKITI